MSPRRGAALAFVVALGACVVGQEERDVAAADYLGVETRLLDDDLVNMVVAVRGGSDDDAIEYARCAAARYALIRDYGFARHVRTSLSEEGGVRRADAIYTISPELPPGLRTLDAEVIVSDCIARGIPTV